MFKVNTEKELLQLSNRQFSFSGLSNYQDGPDINYEWNGYHQTTFYLGLIKQTTPTYALLDSKAPFSYSDKLHFLSPNGCWKKITLD